MRILNQYGNTYVQIGNCLKLKKNIMAKKLPKKWLEVI
ncbi:hypothetical protein BN938_1097 [Mucinivorans hirudinis]|uniref:Uncharacterized protein n=1 Tax=Mucinivorans hirudinis TaxID=1433126 RepID=A0A060RBN2_9BACT|nr:hypothetical protein BN938_1097 [Mucinivorans hirudinis]